MVIESATPPPLVDEGFLRRRFERSIEASERFFTRHAEAIAACASAMADHFFDGGKLLVLGSGISTTDAQHNSVEYVHPVLPGCRALPALSLTNDTATLTGLIARGDAEAVFEHQVKILAAPEDILLAFADLPVSPAVRRALETGRQRQLLTVALLAGAGELEAVAQHQFYIESSDPLVAQEVQLATYHIFWELVHIVLNHRGIAQTAAQKGGPEHG